MSHYLVYWRKFYEEVTDAKEFYDAPYRWKSESKRLHEMIKGGDTIWVVMRERKPFHNEWRLVQQLMVVSSHKNKIKCDKNKSRRFNPASHGDIQKDLKNLRFDPIRPIKFRDSKIGMCLQHERKLDSLDVPLMNSIAAKLKDLTPNDQFVP